MKIPTCKKIPKELTIHNDTRIDNYYWLNDRENPEVIKYLEDENKYADDYLKDTQDLQNELYEEIVGRIDKNETSVPYFLNGYYYFQKYDEGKEYPILVRKKGSLDAEEDVYLNVNDLAEGQNYCSLGKAQINLQDEILGYSADFISRRLYSIYFKNLKTGELLKDVIPNTSGGFAWAKDGKTVFYTLKDETTLRSYKIMKHVLGNDIEDDEVIFEELDEAFTISVSTSKSRDYIFISSHSTLSSEYLFCKSDKLEDGFKVFCPREKDHEYTVYHHRDTFYIHTNWNAKNFRLMKTSIHNTDKKNWLEIIPHNEDVLIENLDFFDDFMVVDERFEGLTRFRIVNQDDNTEHYIDLVEDSYMAQSGTNPEFSSNTFRYVFTSLKTPPRVVDYNMITKTKEIKKTQKVIGGYNPDDFITKRINVKANDDTKIPMSLVYKKGTVLNGENPTLLYAYGSYGHSVDCIFSVARLSLLERGFIFAIAHVRGGEEKGRKWYENGKLLNKINTFTDFINCGEYLINQNYTSSKRLCALGGSAGGLLIGAVINMKPTIWRAVIAAVPFVDVVTTMLDETIPLTTIEYDEWGNPNEENYYHYMKSYSPIDNIEEKDYPSILATTGLHDSQVQYWEPAKWVAKLRELKTDKNVLLFKTNMEVGHGGASGRYEYFKEVAFEYAFLIKEVNLDS